MTPSLFWPFYIWKYNKTKTIGKDFISAIERMIIFSQDRSSIYWGCGYKGHLGNQLRHNLIPVPVNNKGHFRLSSNPDFYNPYQKPPAFNRRLIDMFVPLTPEASIVDLMGGSFSMGCEAMRTGRNCLSFEVEKKMYRLDIFFLLLY